jgi:hypothetical protein
LQDLLEAEQVQVLVTGSLHLVGGVIACIKVLGLQYLFFWLLSFYCFKTVFFKDLHRIRMRISGTGIDLKG